MSKDNELPEVSGTDEHEHCWHMTKRMIVDQRIEEVCCHCGLTRLRELGTATQPPEHGPFFPW